MEIVQSILKAELYQNGSRQINLLPQNATVFCVVGEHVYSKVFTLNFDREEWGPMKLSVAHCTACKRFLNCAEFKDDWKLNVWDDYDQYCQNFSQSDVEPWIALQELFRAN